MKNFLMMSMVTLMLVGCTNNSDNSNFVDSSQVSALSASGQSHIPSKLPDLPTYPLFATFNNAYQILAETNKSIAMKDPVNNDKYFVKVILSSKKTLDCAFFDIDEPEIVDALVIAKKNGVTVRIVTDTDNIKDKVDPTKPRDSIVQLKKAGIPIVDDQRQPFMHHKFMVVDNKAVWSGATNPSSRGIFEHNSNSIYIQSTDLAKNFSDEFNKMFVNHDFGDSRSKSRIANPIVKVGDATIKTYFSPVGGTKDAIIAEINKATKSIKFDAFSYTAKDIADAMIQRKKAGVVVEGIYDECLNGQYSTYNDLSSAGIFVKTDGNQALMHSKTIIIDDITVINGSFNFSKNAELNNNEDELIITSPTIAKAFVAEYARLKNAAITHKNIPPYDHPACQHDTPTAKNSIVGTDPSYELERD